MTTSLIVILLFFIIMSVATMVFFSNSKRNSIVDIQESMVSIYKADEDYSQEQIKKIELNSTKYPSGFFSQTNKILPLSNYAIKASRNSAYDGAYISNAMIQYILSKGCRWLDFEVYYMLDNNNKPQCVVGYSFDKNATYPTNSNVVPVPLYRMIKKTIENAMTVQNGNTHFTTNTEDPLFIHIRIKTDPANREELYKMVDKTIQNVSKDEMYSKYAYNSMNSINHKTTLQEISNKVVFVFDHDARMLDLEIYQKMMEKYLICGNGQIIDVPVSQVNINKYPSNEPPKIISNDMISSDKLQYVYVDDEKAENVDLRSAFLDYGFQIVEQKYYMNDNRLKNNELYWQNYKQGIVLMSYMLNYMKY